VDKHEDEKRGNNAEPFGLIQKDRGAYGVGYLFVICGFSLAEPENREGDLSWVEPLKARGVRLPQKRRMKPCKFRHFCGITERRLIPF